MMYFKNVAPPLLNPGDGPDGTPTYTVFVVNDMQARVKAVLRTQ